MKKSLIIIMSLLLFSLVNAQTKNELTKKQKNDKRKAVLVEIIDISGEKHNGYLYSADSTSIILTNSYLEDSVLTAINFVDIYKIKLLKKQNFADASRRISLSAGLVHASVLSLLYYYSIHPLLGKGAVSLFLAAVLGNGANMIITATDTKLIDIDYINIAENVEDFAINKKFFKKNSLNYETDSIITINKINVERDEDKLLKVEKPLILKHPKAGSLIHISVSHNYFFNSLTNQYSDIIQASDYPNFVPENYSFDKNVNGLYKINVFATNNLRPYFSFQHNTHNYHSYLTENESTLYIFTHNYQFAIGTDYVFSPVNKMFSKKYEIAAGAGIVLHKYNSKVTANYHWLTGAGTFNSSTSNLIGLNMNASFDYYLSRRISIKLSGAFNLMPSKTLSDISAYSGYEGKILEVKNIKINTSNYHFGIGLAIHLIN